MDTNKAKSAILLIEFQNQWTKKGLYHRLIKGQLEKRGVLENTKNLVDRARERGMKIIHAPLVIDPKNKRGWLAFLTFGKVFTKGTWKSEISEGLFREGDLLVKGRYAFDAFVGSDLENILRENGIETVFVCGFTTDQCVAKTMRTLIKKGFKAYLVSDCTAAMSHKIQQKIEREFVTVESAELTKEL